MHQDILSLLFSHFSLLSIVTLRMNRPSEKKTTIKMSKYKRFQGGVEFLTAFQHYIVIINATILCRTKTALLRFILT